MTELVTVGFKRKPDDQDLFNLSKAANGDWICDCEDGADTECAIAEYIIRSASQGVQEDYVWAVEDGGCPMRRVWRFETKTGGTGWVQTHGETMFSTIPRVTCGTELPLWHPDAKCSAEPETKPQWDEGLPF